MSRTKENVIQAAALVSALTGSGIAGYSLTEYANNPQQNQKPEFISVDPDLVVVPDWLKYSYYDHHAISFYEAAAPDPTIPGIIKYSRVAQQGLFIKGISEGTLNNTEEDYNQLSAWLEEMVMVINYGDDGKQIESTNTPKAFLEPNFVSVLLPDLYLLEADDFDTATAWLKSQIQDPFTLDMITGAESRYYDSRPLAIISKFTDDELLTFSETVVTNSLSDEDLAEPLTRAKLAAVWMEVGILSKNPLSGGEFGPETPIAKALRELLSQKYGITDVDNASLSDLWSALDLDHEAILRTESEALAAEEAYILIQNGIDASLANKEEQLVRQMAVELNLSPEFERVALEELKAVVTLEEAGSNELVGNPETLEGAMRRDGVMVANDHDPGEGVKFKATTIIHELIHLYSEAVWQKTSVVIDDDEKFYDVDARDDLFIRLHDFAAAFNQDKDIDTATILREKKEYGGDYPAFADIVNFVLFGKEFSTRSYPTPYTGLMSHLTEEQLDELYTTFEVDGLNINNYGGAHNIHVAEEAIAAIAELSWLYLEEGDIPLDFRQYFGSVYELESTDDDARERDLKNSILAWAGLSMPATGIYLWKFVKHLRRKRQSGKITTNYPQ